MSKIIHVIGFGWSGSSAILDALYDQEMTQGVTGHNYPLETALFRPKNSPLDFAKVYSQRNRLDINGLLALYTGGRVGLNESLYKDEIENYLKRVSKKQITPGNSRNFDDIANSTLKDALSVIVNKKTLTTEELIGNYYEITYELIKWYADETNKTILLNNDPHGRKLKQFQLFDPESIFVFVIREPLDMIVDRPRYKNMDSFGVKATLKRIKFSLSHAKIISKSLYNAMFIKRNKPESMFVSFESFVGNTKYRNNILQSLLKIETNNIQYILFNPEDSKKNTNLHNKKMNFINKLIVKSFCFMPIRKIKKIN